MAAPDGLAVVPASTLRDELGRPFDTTRKVPSGRELAPLDPVDPSHASLVYLDRWATTFLREEGGMAPMAFVYSTEARVRKWDLLRRLHSVIYSQSKYKVVSIENALWAAAGADGMIGLQVYVTALVGAFKFDRKLRMESRLKRLFKCFEGAESNSVDYRETVVGLRILEDSKQIPKRSRELLSRYYEMFSSSEDGSISRAAALRLVGIAAESESDLENTRGRFLAGLSKAAPHYGLKPSTSWIPHELFLEVFELDPKLLEYFQQTMWSRVKDDSKLDYLKEQEQESEQRFDYIDHKLKAQKAIKMFSNSLLRSTWNTWFKYYSYHHEVNNKRLYILYKRTQRCVLFWASWASQNNARVRRQRIALVMGRIRVQRQRFIRWRRFLHNRLRIVYACRRHTELWRNLSEGFSCLRFAWNAWSKRLALGHWWEYTLFYRKWMEAVALHAKKMKTSHFLAWQRYTAEKQAMYRREATARETQYMFKKMQKDIQDELEKAREEAEEKMRQEKEAEKQRKIQEKQSKAYWRRHRKLAQKKMDDKYIRKLQEENQRERAAMKRRLLKENFDAKWAAKEQEMVVEAKQQRELWLKDKAISRARVRKAYEDLKKEFFQPPSPETEEREKQLHALANVVLINIESVLFRQGKLLKDWLKTFDVDGDGYLSHEEFKNIFTELKAIQFTSDQIRSVIQTLDEDDDGMITIAEMEKQAELVEKYCGQFGSPWKTYIDPAQDVLCYHNIRTDEKLYDYQMTNKRFREINLANLIAEAEYNARVECRRLRDEDWVLSLRDFSSRIMQNMHHQWKARKGMEKLRWKYQRMVKEQQKQVEDQSCRLLQARWRGLTTRRNLRPYVAKYYFKRVDPSTGVKYYENAYTGDITYERPLLHRRFFPGIDW